MSTYHHGNLREVLIAEGAKIVEEKGFNALTLREIGERAGVSRTAPYRHFADKSELLEAIREAGFTEFAQALEAARDSATGRFAARFEAMGRAYLKFAEERRPYYQVMFGERRTTRGSAAGQRAFAVLEGMIKAGQASGDVRPGDSAALAKVVWAVVHGLATLRLDLDFKIVAEVLRTGL